MEETVFEYCFEENDEFIKEYLIFINFKTPSRKCFYVFYFFIVALWVFISISSGNRYDWFVTAGLVAFFLITLFLFKRSIKLAKKRKKEMYGDSQAVFEAYVTENGIRFINNANHAKSDLPFSTFVKLYESDTLILLKSGSKLFYIFSKEGFTKGTPDEFVKFVRSKGIK